jgi:putative DNA primase/helicase
MTPKADVSRSPNFLRPILKNIPDELKESERFVLWRGEHRDGRITKRPFQLNGQPASHSDPRTWSTFNQVEAAYMAAPGRWNGIGIVLTAEDELVGIDLDHVRDATGGELVEWAHEWIEVCASYAELSPSGTGVRIFIRGHLPDGGANKKGGLAPNGHGAIEVYNKLRYLTLTGHRIDQAPPTIEPRQDALEGLLAKYNLLSRIPENCTSAEPIRTNAQRRSSPAKCVRFERCQGFQGFVRTR